MRFQVTARYRADPDAVARAYANPDLYGTFTDLPRTAPPDVIGQRTDGGIVELQVRWRFTADLSGAAKRVIDPNKLSWVETSRHDVAARRTTFRMTADHYADRLTCSGEYRFTPAPDGGTTRTVEGELRVRAPLVAKVVEQAIVSGLEEQLRSEVVAVDAFLA